MMGLSWVLSSPSSLFFKQRRRTYEGSRIQSVESVDEEETGVQRWNGCRFDGGYLDVASCLEFGVTSVALMLPLCMGAMIFIMC